MEKAKKSRLSDKQKKAINITVITVEILIVILAIAFSVSILLSTGYETSTDFGDASVRLMPVLTGSMSGDNPDSFDEGDLIIVNKATPERIAELEVGDIITYAGNVGGGRGFITHRIVDVEQFTNSLGNTYRIFYTRGDDEAETVEPTAVYETEVAGIYSWKIAGLGSAIYWLQQPTNFFLVVMLPLILLLVYNIYLVIRMVVEAKIKKQQRQTELAIEQARNAAVLDEEEIKRRAIEEYLASKNAASPAEEDKGAADAPTSPDADGADDDAAKEPNDEKGEKTDKE